MAFFKGFPGHYHPDPHGAEHRATMAARGWTVIREEPLTWLASDGGLMRAVPTPQLGAQLAQWFVAGLSATDSTDVERIAKWEALTAGSWRYCADMWAKDAAGPSDGLDIYETVAQAREAAGAEVARVAAIEPELRDETLDWAVHFTIRPCVWDLDEPALDETELNSIDPALETEMRVVMGYRLTELLRVALTPGMFELCRLGDSDPCDFIDDNDCTMDAYGEVFGGEWDLDRPEVASRANAGTRVAAKLIRAADEGISISQLRRYAEENDSVGLTHTITRKV